ncbi:MAG: FtsQ-type POTRA domain-containing protein [Actinomycetes bacterium]|jgi:cell division protein FtsQ
MTTEYEVRRSRIIKGIIALLLVVSIALVYALGWSNLLSVKKIAISGTTQVSSVQETLSKTSSHLQIGKPLARVDLRVIKSALLHLSWVGDAKVNRSWIHGTIAIQISERTPIATFTTDSGEVKLFDASGAEFTSLATNAGLPVIEFTTTDPAARKAVAHLLAGLPSDLLSGLTGMRVSSPAMIEMSTKFTSRTITIRWGDDRDMVLKTKVLRALFALPENTKANLFDLSAPTAPIVK